MKTLIMIATIMTTLNAHSSSGGSFICVSDGALYSSNFSSAIGAFKSVNDCQMAVDKSKNGFICTGNGALYSANIQTVLGVFNSQKECQMAIERSK